MHTATAFRIFTRQDIPAIVDMMRQFNAIDDYPFNEKERNENLELLLANSNYGCLWVIQFNAEIAGYMFLGFGFSFEFKGRDAFVDELFIRPEFRGKGIGNQAIDFVISEAKRLGIKVLHLEAEKHNEQALRLYRNKGFKDHNRFLLSNYL